MFVVLEARLELARSCPRKILSLVCLPIPPFEQKKVKMSEFGKITYFAEKSNHSRVLTNFLHRDLSFRNDEYPKK